MSQTNTRETSMVHTPQSLSQQSGSAESRTHRPSAPHTRTSLPTPRRRAGRRINRPEDHTRYAAPNDESGVCILNACSTTRWHAQRPWVANMSSAIDATSSDMTSDDAPRLLARCDRALELDQTTLDWLSRHKGPLAVLAVAGPARSGKCAQPPRHSPTPCPKELGRPCTPQVEPPQPPV